LYFIPSLDTEDADEQAAPTHTPDGKRIPPQDLLVGELNFGITLEEIQTWNMKTQEGANILAEETPDQILAALRELYDGMKGLEASGLRGRDLFLAVKQNQKLMKLSGRYYPFVRTQIWGYRQQSVWFVR
jgi:hypothetical protein